MSAVDHGLRRVVVERIAYREHGHPDLHPADAQLNLPVEHHSHGLRRLAAIEATRGSYGHARAAADVGDLYTTHLPDPVDILPAPGHEPRQGPVMTGKWLAASVERDHGQRPDQRMGPCDGGWAAASGTTVGSLAPAAPRRRR